MQLTDEMSMSDQQLKNYYELCALTCLKYLFPIKYKNVILKDSPDLQGDNIGVEVTIAESYDDMRAEKEFDRYCRDNDDRRLKTIVKCNKSIRFDDVRVMYSVGGYNSEDIQLLINRIEDKRKKAFNNYQKFKQMELFIIKKSLVVGEWREKLIKAISPLINDCKFPYNRVYILYPHECLIIDRDGKTEKKELSCEVFQRIKFISKQAVLNEISIDDVEWEL